MVKDWIGETGEPSAMLAPTQILLFLMLLKSMARAQVFQMFLVDGKGENAQVLDTIKLPTCTHLDIQHDVTLRGGIKSGNFTKLGYLRDMQTCIDACCQDEQCDVAFMPGHVCYSVSCFSAKLCESIPAVPSIAANRSVRISHVVRGGGKGDDLEQFKKTQGMEKYTYKGKDQCTPSRIITNHTLKGGKTAGELKDLGIVESIEDCVEKCCHEKTCEVAFIVNDRCHSVECYGDELCQSLPIESEKMSPTIIYMNVRNGNRIKDKETCSPSCVSGICSAKDMCVCDRGFEGLNCNQTSTTGFCGVSGCGENGKCSWNDTCVCETGYFGHLCNHTLKCDPPCENGRCIDNSTNSTKCFCEIGWEGQFCNKSNGDMKIYSPSGGEVLFTKMDQEAEMDIKIHQIPSQGAESISALAVAIGCGVAAAIVGTATVAFIARKILGKRSTNYELLRTPIKHNKT
ncbi:neurogenic locus Notch protein-like isoform X1 [Montipora capricornis]|uniref:neurogenic locus Notch protein-like isoform X1 n=1 Tax=Montipora capricornis TaxID=246305 RepID=UPI0035F164A8